MGGIDRGQIDRSQKQIQDATLAVALITNFTTPFAVTALNIAVPHIGVEFGASATSLTWVMLSFLLVTSILSIPFGRLADIYGRQRIFKAGILLFLITSILNIFAPNMAVFILCRALQGVGGAMIYSTNIAILVDVFPASRRGSVLGIAVACVYIGSSLGPVIGGLITNSFGWRGVFVVISLISFIAFITAILRSPKENDNKDESKRVKVSSILIYVLSVGLFLYGLATFMQNLWSYFIIAAGIVLVIIYIRYEIRTDNPLIEMRLFKGNRLFSLSLLAAIFNYAAIIAIAFLMSLYLQLGRGLAADISGLILIVQPVVQASLSPVAGRLSDKKSPAMMASFGMACCAAALIMFVFLNEQTPIPYVIAGLLLTGFGIAFFSSPNSNVILGAVSNKDYGVATSMISTARTYGQVTGMAMLTIIMHLVIGDVPIAEVGPSVLITDMRISYIVFAGICIIGVFISLRRRER